MVLRQHICTRYDVEQKPLHGLNHVVNWPIYLIGPLALLLVVFHFLESHFQVYLCLCSSNVNKY
jgi:hypothetical protein